MRGNLKSEIRMTRSGGLLGLALVCLALRGLAQDAMPKLLPPLGEIPPSFWEQHGNTVMISALFGLLLLAFGVWLLLRPRPVVAPPPDLQARRALEALLPQPEDGQAISRASQILRRYVQAAFQLPAGEPTTTEFCELIANRDDIGEPLTRVLADFLRQCDERKFARSESSPALGAAARALELVGQGEARRAELRQQASDPASQPATASK